MAQVRVVLKSVYDDKALKQAQKSFQGISDGISTTFKAIGVAAVAAGAAIVKLSSDSIKAASSLQESTNAVNVAFGDSAAAILKIGESAASSLGLARTEFNQAAVRFSAFAERVVGQGGDVAGFIGDITTRAADFASVFNIEVSEALQVFQSGLSGEAEPLKRFGINLLESEVKAYALRTGLIKVGETMTEQQKVQARYGLLLESTAKTAGDFANTADSLANRQRILKATFTDIQAEIGKAMLPALESLVGVVVDDLLPVFKEVGEKVGPALGEVLEFIAEVFGEAFTEGTDLNKALDKLEDSFKLLFSAITNGQNDAEGFADFLAKLVYVVDFLVTSLAAVIAGFQGIGIAFDALARGDFETFWKFLTMDTIEFVEEMKNAENAANGLNNVDLSKFRGQLGDTRVDAQRLVNAQKQLYYAMRGLAVPTTPDSPDNDTPDDQRKNVESSFEKVQKFIKNAQNDLARAQEKYNKTLASSQKKYAEAVLKTERDFAEKLANIVQQSQDRLRTAFASVVRISLADIFEVEETKSVANLVSGLTSRLRKSQALLERAGKLNAAGFSQTFIEQVVAAGTETGNELAQAILDATPETQRELQSLFSAIETTAETGMDSLARQIYDSAGLATTELRELYAQTQTELTEALLKLKEDFDQEVLDANNTLLEAIKDIGAGFKANIESMKGDLGGLDAAVTAFQNKLKNLELKTQQQVKPTPTGAGAGPGAGGGLVGVNMAASAVTNATGILIDSATDVAKVLDYLTERIVAANEFAAQSINRGQMAAATSAQQTRDELMAQLRVLRAAGPSAVGTVINVNVKTDSTQSLAMVGKSLGNTITKYVQSGGQVVVSPVG